MHLFQRQVDLGWNPSLAAHHLCNCKQDMEAPGPLLTGDIIITPVKGCHTFVKSIRHTVNAQKIMAIVIKNAF